MWPPPTSPNPKRQRNKFQNFTQIHTVYYKYTAARVNTSILTIESLTRFEGRGELLPLPSRFPWLLPLSSVSLC